MVKPVLLIGGYGKTGRKTALQLRALHPDLPLAIAGRDLVAAQAFADELGNASAYKLDLWDNGDQLGLPNGEFSALATFLMDDTGRSMAFAKRHGFGSISVTGGAFELGVQVVTAMRAAADIPVVLAGNWFCGAALWPVLELCGSLDHVLSVTMGIVIDRSGGAAGPATTADFERILGACTSMPRRSNGRYEWASGTQGTQTYVGTGGRKLEGRLSVSIDAVTIGAITNAADVTVLETWGDSLSSLNGGNATDEVVIEARGLDASGREKILRQEIIASREKCPFTAVAVALLLEKMAGLRGKTLPAGLYFPENVLDPADANHAMRAAGIEFGPVQIA